MKTFPVFECHTWMGMYGAPTPKATKLWTSTQAFAVGLRRHLLRNKFKKSNVRTCIYRVDKNGKKRTYGIKKVLKDTQAYPKRYGEKVAEIFKEAHFAHPAWKDITQDSNSVELGIEWGSARIDAVVERLRSAFNE